MSLAAAWTRAAICLALGVGALSFGSAAAGAVDLPNGFQDTKVIADLEEPTTFRFSGDGRIFVAEKAGRILAYHGLGDEDPTVFADMRAQVYDNGDRGILGMALDPEFPSRPYVYVLYTFDHVIGEDAPGFYPRWGQPPTYAGDPCPKPPGADVDACPVSGRLVRLTAEGDRAVQNGGKPLEDVLVEDWCQQFSSHSIGDLRFGPEGALFASGGEGASFTSSDYGQFGWPQANQCGDPPNAIGDALEPPDAEGGSLRAQDARTPSDPTGLDGSVIRIDPETGEGLAKNPMATSADPNARRIIAYGFRNPFRFSINPESHEVYVNNVGNGTAEEIDRFSIAPGQAYDSGWPCYEGTEPNPGFEFLELNLCEGLYDEPGSVSPPFFYYDHGAGVTPEDTCPSYNGSAISGSAFYYGKAFPPSYDGAFFFADSVRGCIYAMFADEDGRPDPSTAAPFLTDGGLYPGIDIEVGPEGDLYYVSLFGDEYGPGSIHRISYFSGNQPPVGRLTATPQWAVGTLDAQFDATGSSDADGEQLTYEWDPQGDGTYEAPTSVGKKSKTFTDAKNHTVAVRVSDGQGASSVARVTVYPGDTPPEPEIVDPEESAPGSGRASLEWGVGQPIEFDGVAHDAEDEDLAKTSLSWSSRLYHCPGGPESCHAHPLQAFPSVAAGILIAPDHDYPSHIELTLSATDSRGLSATRAIVIYPRTVDLEIASSPPGLTLTAGLLTEPGPFALTAIEGSSITLAAPQVAPLDGITYTWTGWSDGGARVHTIVAYASTTYTASYAAAAQPPATPAPAVKAREPVTALHRHPRKRTMSTTARFAFSGDPGGSFRCKLDGGPFRPCRSPRIYSDLRPGWHAFRVAAVDEGGVVDPTPAIFRWKVLR